METLGVWLRRAREEKGSSPAQVELATRIRPRFLEMLEAGNFSALPGGDMQARGFLRVYARYLGLSVDEAIARYEVECHGAVPPGSNGGSPGGEPLPPVPRPLATQNLRSDSEPSSALMVPAQGRRGAAEKLLIAGLSFIAVLIAVLGVTYYLRLRTGETSRAEAFVAQPTEAISVAVAELTPDGPAPTPTFPVSVGGGVTLTLKATEHTWVHVASDNQTVFRGILLPDRPQTWIGKQMILVETGNGAGLWVTVNDQLQGPMGERGKVSRRAWGPSGEVEAPPQTES